MELSLTRYSIILTQFLWVRLFIHADTRPYLSIYIGITYALCRTKRKCFGASVGIPSIYASMERRLDHKSTQSEGRVMQFLFPFFLLHAQTDTQTCRCMVTCLIRAKLGSFTILVGCMGDSSRILFFFWCQLPFLLVALSVPFPNVVKRRSSLSLSLFPQLNGCVAVTE